MISLDFLILLLFILLGQLEVSLVNIILKEAKWISQLYDEGSHLLQCGHIVSQIFLQILNVHLMSIDRIGLVGNLDSELGSRWVVLSSIEPKFTLWETSILHILQINLSIHNADVSLRVHNTHQYGCSLIAHIELNQSVVVIVGCWSILGLSHGSRVTLSDHNM